MKKYKVTLPDGRVVIKKGTGPYFVAWRLSRTCKKAWAAKDNKWLSDDGRQRIKQVREKARRLRLTEGWSSDTVAASRVPNAKNRLMCGKANVKIIKGEELL